LVKETPVPLTQALLLVEAVVVLDQPVALRAGCKMVVEVVYLVSLAKVYFMQVAVAAHQNQLALRVEQEVPEVAATVP
jgi:hypothetical protein